MNKGDHVGLTSTFEALMKLLKNKIFYKLERTGEELEEVVGGLGKNKLHNTSIGGWAQQIRYFTNSDGSMRFVAGNKQLARANVILNDHVTITEDMILTGCAAGGAAGTYKLQIKRNDDDSIYADDIGSGANVPVSTFGNGTCTVQVCLYKNLELSQDLMFYPMLRAANVADATFEPYYNKLELGYSGEQSDWTESDSTSLAFIKNKPTLGTAAVKDTPASGDASATQVVMGNDSRLTNSRTPTSHTHTKSEITDFPTMPSAYTSDPQMDGTANAGSSSAYAKGDHVHPTDTSRMPMDAGFEHSNNIQFKPDGYITCLKSGGGWDDALFSRSCFTDNVSVTFKAPTIYSTFVVGLSSTTFDMYEPDYGFMCSRNGTLDIIEGNTQIAPPSGHDTYAANDEFRIDYTNGYVKYYHNGVLIRSVARALGSPLYLVGCFYFAGSICNLEFSTGIKPPAITYKDYDFYDVAITSRSSAGAYFGSAGSVAITGKTPIAVYLRNWEGASKHFGVYLYGNSLDCFADSSMTVASVHVRVAYI